MKKMFYFKGFVLSFMVFFVFVQCQRSLLTEQDIAIYFDLDGGIGNMENTIKIKRGEIIKKPSDPVKDGYVFVEWRINLYSVPFDFGSPVEKSITLVAIWSKLPQNITQYTLSFESNGGSSISPQTINSGQKAVRPTNPTKSGYIFDGWYSSSNLSGNEFDFNTIINSNMKLYAKWNQEQIQIQNYTLSFESNGGSSVSPQTINSGQKALRPTNPTRSGYIFDGWYSSSNLSGSEFDFNTMITSNITLYAKWIQNISAVFTLSSTDIANGQTIDSRFLCSSFPISFTWSNAPAGTLEFVLIMDDDTAPDCGKQDQACKHWSVFNIPVNVTSSSGFTSELQGSNYTGGSGYAGPCPPSRHKYTVKIYALNQRLSIQDSFNLETRFGFERTHNSNIIGSATLEFYASPSF